MTRFGRQRFRGKTRTTTSIGRAVCFRCVANYTGGLAVPSRGLSNVMLLADWRSDLSFFFSRGSWESGNGRPGKQAGTLSGATGPGFQNDAASGGGTEGEGVLPGVHWRTVPLLPTAPEKEGSTRTGPRLGRMKGGTGGIPPSFLFRLFLSVPGPRRL